MLNVLLVEDDSFKSDEILSLLYSLQRGIKVRTAKSVSSAINAIQEEFFDLIVLDMALPSHSVSPGAGAPLSLLNGGLEVLFELQSRNRRDPCLVVTQYPEIEICGDFYPVEYAPTAIQENYEIRVLGCVEYGQPGTDWRKNLINLYEKLCAF